MLTQLRCRFATSFVGIGLMFCVRAAPAATIDKTNNSDALHLPSSWVGGLVPGTTDTAQWAAGVTGANVVALGANLGWAALRIGNPGGPVTLNGANTLTLATNGTAIDLANATQDLTLGCDLALGASQSWNVGAGRTATLTGDLTGTSQALTKTGAGSVVFSGGAGSLQNLYVSGGKFSLASGTLGVSGSGDNASSISGGTLEQTGGTMNSSFYTRLGSANAGTLVVKGGTFNNSGEILLGYGGAGAGTLTVTNSGAVSAHFLRLGNNAAGTANLDGGTVTANRIFSNNGQGTVNFNGGTLRPGGSTSSPWLESTVPGVFVRNGGAVIDTAGRNATVTASLRAAAGSTGGLTKQGTGTLTLTGTSNNFAGPVTVSGGSLVVHGRSTGTGLVTVIGGTTLGGTGVVAGAVEVRDNGTLAAGTIPFSIGSLWLSNSAVLHLGLGTMNAGTNAALRVTGNVILDGQLLVTDGGGLATGQTLAGIGYTGSLTDRGVSLHPLSAWSVTLDTNTPGLVKVVVGQKFPFVDFGAGEMAVTTLTTNLSVTLHGTSTRTMWYETRDQSGRMWDFGAHVPSSPWNFTVRHLREGTNTVTVFAQPATGALQSNTLRLVLTLGAEPAVRPRPVPAEIWWGGLSTNQQLLDPAKPWDFVKKFQDGVFFHSAGYGGLTSTDKQNLAALLRPFNARYWVELGGGTSSPGDAWVTFQGDTGWGAHLNSQQSLGLVMSQITHDYHMENMEDVCRAHPDWPANDLVAWWTGDLTQAGPAYPYASGLWRDVSQLYYADSPHLKIGHTSSSVYWTWGGYPILAGAWNNLLYNPLRAGGSVPGNTSSNAVVVNGTNVSFSFTGREIILGFVRMAASNAHPYFSFQTDFPWDYFGTWGNPTSAATNRAKIRHYERELQTNGARHTLICNVSNAGAQGGGNDAQDNYYKTSSFNSMTLHQAEGGRANVYLFESWYEGIPHAAAPESKPGSYANLALDAIKYLKGIRDTNGALQQLALTLVSTGATSIVRLQNNGDIACLPALLAMESGDPAATTRYYTSNGVDITSAVLSAEGYVYTNRLAPGAFVQFSVVTTLPANASNTVSKSISLEAFWNPQDPLGIVRDRETVALTVAPATLLPSGAVWKFLDDGSNQGADWRSNSFNDAAWKSGVAKLGFGGDGEATLLNRTNAGGTTNITFYFRRQFYVPDAAGVSSLTARMIRDDGVVVYLNGAEVWRDSMPAGTPSHLTLASATISGAAETNWLTNPLGPASLVTGWNTLAAEVHQSTNTSSDLGFAFELTGTVRVLAQPSLAFAPAPGALQLAWPADAAYFPLHSATNLTPPVAWTPLTNAPVLTNNQWRVTLPAPTQGQRYFRLQSP